VGPLLSVIIPSHNRADLLRLCLGSVLRYAPPGTEVLVVDDASPAGAVSAQALDYRGVRVIRLERQIGFCAAVNAGVAFAQAAIVEVLNDDTEVAPGWAESALDAFTNPQVAAVTPLVLIGPPSTAGSPRVDSAGDRYYRGGVAGKRGHGEELGPQHLVGGPVFGASGSSAFYRRSALVEVGGFPEELKAYFDDVDLSFRLHRAGYQVWYTPHSRVWHRVSSSYGKADPTLLALQSRNEELVFWRNLPAGELLAALPAHAAVLAGKAVRRWREGRLLPFLAGRLAALGQLPATWRHRRRLRSLGPAASAAWGVEARWWGA
jgi:GT2 family glycosyltransferase